jgi:hypothetical protein
MCNWVVFNSGIVDPDRAVSRHQSETAAKRAADKIGGCYESADIVATMANGLSYTEAVQFHAGKARTPARVWVAA